VVKYRELFRQAREAGLGTTIHTGETSHTGADGVIAVLSELKPTRIGHGIAAAKSDEAVRRLVDTGTVLEICPTSNMRTHAVKDLAELRGIVQRFFEAGVKVTINTDGTYLLGTTLRQEFDLLLAEGTITPQQAQLCIANAKAASFIRP
jgi:adenosine deaminase